MNDLDLCLEAVSRSCQPYVTFNVEYLGNRVRYRGLVPKDHQSEMAYGVSNGRVTDDVA